MRRLIMLVASLCALQSSASEPLTFKGINLGANQGDFLTLMPGIQCKDDRCMMDLRLQCKGRLSFDELLACQRQFDYGGQRVFWLSGTFVDDRLVFVRAIVDTKAFAPLLAAMRERFGEPDYDKPGTVQNRMGAVFDDRTVSWMRDDAILILRQRSSKLDESSISLTSKSYLEKQKQETEQKAKEAAKKL